MSDSPPAFPVSTIDGFTNDGMTLRDWFAGQALAGGLIQHYGYPLYKENVAQSAYDLADAMLAERSKA